MLSRNLKPFLLIIALVVTAAAQDRDSGKKKNLGGTPVLWERVNVARQDTFYGPGGREGQPDLSRITFIREDKGGYSKKYRIEDGSGRVWVAKIGKEAQSETAAVRLLAALGYATEINYLVPRLTIPGMGTFSNVRLEARPDDVDRGREWRWDKNAFTGTRPMQGLKIMMVFFNNWDMKNANNVILKTHRESQYVVSDLGVTFGKTGFTRIPLLWWIGRSRNNPKDFSKSDFVTGTNRNRVKFNFNGKNYQVLKNVTVMDARWLADLLSRLSDRQIRDAFRAANYSQSDINLLTRAVKARITELERVGIGRRVARS